MNRARPDLWGRRLGNHRRYPDRWSTASPQSSALAVLCSVGLPRCTVKVRLRRPWSQALPGRPLRRLATTSDEKSGLKRKRRVGDE